MKKIVLTLSTLMSLFACQTGKMNTVKTELKIDPEPQTNAQEVLISLNDCYND